jgi:hypothetical protein
MSVEKNAKMKLTLPYIKASVATKILEMKANAPKAKKFIEILQKTQEGEPRDWDKIEKALQVGF